MIVYIFDQENLYAGKKVAQKHPFKSEFLIPKNATTIAPPEDYSINQQPKFNGVSWELVPSKYKEEQDAIIEQQQQSLLETTNNYGIYEYTLDDDGNVVPRPQETIDEEIAAIVNTSLLEDLKYNLDETILNKAKEVTRGTNMSSVQAFIQAFQLRLSYPLDYVNKGLKVYYAIGSYALGDSLDTATKIEEYYKQILIYLDEQRELEISNYLVARAAIS